MPSIDPTNAMRALVAAHDNLVDQLGGDPYVTVTASWRAGDDAPLTTLSYSTIDADDEEDE